MSPALLDKYLKAARDVASHLFLKPSGFAFAPTPMLAETDRDQFCVMQIIDFYRRQDIDYADYFLAAWRFKHRAALGKSKGALADFAAQDKVSAKYLATIWSNLEGPKVEIGPMAKLQSMWCELPAPSADSPDPARNGCEQMRDYVPDQNQPRHCHDGLFSDRRCVEAYGAVDGIDRNCAHAVILSEMLEASSGGDAKSGAKELNLPV